ncbi:hypothetical protein K438DRAFT_2171093 [Mycena galopus ATCC 62051]|nr:hypothetical protein K438DRAFT_2171093 [Mycena galopus ATCC 62051]
MNVLTANNPGLHTSERIEFFQLQQTLLHDLLGSDNDETTQFFTCDLAHALQGSIIVEFSTNLGIGTFKSAHLARLTLNHLPPHGLGTTPNELVAVKRMYRRRTNNGVTEKSVVTRYSPADEYAKTVEEANLLYWASSLMEFTPAHILAFEIPQLRFQRQQHLFHEEVEEFIEGGSDTFIKFVHNGDATPLLDADDELYHIAEFLCFTQHLQYFKTDKAVFLSDLQGSATLLTDPQIMTSSYDSFFLNIAEGKNIFGDGNVSSIFDKFPEQHICNRYWQSLYTLAAAELCSTSMTVTQSRLINMRITLTKITTEDSSRGLDQLTYATIKDLRIGYLAKKRGAPAFHTKASFGADSVVIASRKYGDN